MSILKHCPGNHHNTFEKYITIAQATCFSVLCDKIKNLSWQTLLTIIPKHFFTCPFSTLNTISFYGTSVIDAHLLLFQNSTHGVSTVSPTIPTQWIFGMDCCIVYNAMNIWQHHHYHFKKISNLKATDKFRQHNLHEYLAGPDFISPFILVKKYMGKKH